MDRSLKNALACPFVMLIGVLALSVFSLLAAYIAEYVFGLKPCILCLYQRIPFAVAIVLSLGALLIAKNMNSHKKTIGMAGVGLSGLAYFVNGSIATYHTGVEQKWWDSHLEGCAAPIKPGMTAEELMASIMAAPTVRCDEIPWADPILGLSMANMNMTLGFGVAGLCALSLVLTTRSKPKT